MSLTREVNHPKCHLAEFLGQFLKNLQNDRQFNPKLD